MNAKTVAILLATLVLAVQAQNTNELEARLNNEIQATKSQAEKAAQDIEKAWSNYTQSRDRIAQQFNETNAQNDQFQDDIVLLKEKISQSSATKDIPFILLAYHKDTASVQRAMALGIDRYLQKPYFLAEVLGIIRNKLSNTVAE